MSIRFNIALFNPNNEDIYIQQLKVLIQSIIDIYEKNTSISLYHNSVKNSFMKYWRDKTNKILESKHPYGSGWGAADQQVFGEKILKTKEISRMGKLIKKGGIRFRGLKLKGFPCKQLNNILSPSPDDPNVHVIHYKGSWRDILPNGTWNKTDLRKKSENGIKLLNLWRETLQKFENS